MNTNKNLTLTIFEGVTNDAFCAMFEASKGLPVLQLILFFSLVTLQRNTISIPCKKTYVEMFGNICSGTLQAVVSMYGQVYKESKRLKFKKKTLF